MITDSYITNYSPSHGYDTETRLEIGMNSPFLTFSWYSSHSLLKFNVSSIPNDATISEAKVQLYLYKEVGGNPTNVSARDITSAWDSYDGWSQKPTVGTAFSTTTIDAVGSYHFPINPQWVKGWLSGQKENFGVYLDCVNKSEASLKYFYSSESGLADKSPKLIITYEGGMGLESYWPYLDFPVAPSGVASVNLFNGNMIFTKSDLFIPARGFSLAFGLVYNSFNKTDQGFGYGWTSEANSKVRVNANGNLVYLIHADGSEHLFTKNSTGYGSPHGVDLKLYFTYGDPRCTFKNANGDSYIYDAQTGRLLEKKNKFQSGISYTYDGAGKLIKISDAKRSISLGYTSNRLSSITAPDHRSAQYTYDSYGNLHTYTDFGGEVTTFLYDGQHNLQKVSDPKGQITYVNYFPGTSKVQFVITADKYDPQNLAANRTFFNYKPIVGGFETTVNYPMGNTKVFTLNYDGTLKQEEKLNGNSAVHTYQYDKRRLTASSNEKVTMKYGYAYTNPDGIPDLVQIGVMDGSNEMIKRKMVYDNYHNVTSLTDARQNTTTFQWSTDGMKLERIIDAENNTVEYKYNSYGEVMGTTFVNSSSSKFTNYTDYDEYGNVSATAIATNGKLAYSWFGYDILGNLTSAHDADNKVKIYKYNESNLLESVSIATATVTYPEITPTEPGITAIDNPTLPYDPSPGPSDPVLPWNPFPFYQKPMITLSPEVLMTTYTYDRNKNLETITYNNQAGQQVQRFTYTPVNLVDIITYPDVTYENYDYDSNHRLEKVSYSDGKSITYQYNNLNQLTYIFYADGTVVAYTYDRYGNRETMQDNRGKITYEYDQFNRLASESKPSLDPFAVPVPGITYGYDEEDNLILEAANGVMVYYTYNKVNLLKTVSNPFTTITALPGTGKTTYEYDNLYNVTKVTYPDNTAELFTYDTTKRIKSITYQNILSDTSFHYTYTDAGDVTSIIKKSPTENFKYQFTYDDLHQLRTAEQYDLTDPTLKKIVEEFKYDAMGNRIERVENGVKWSYTYDPNNKLTRVQRNFGDLVTTDFGYDSRGSMTQNGTTNYTWNDQFMLASVNKHGDLYQFKYDGDGRRYQQSINSKMINYVLDKNWMTFHETDASNNVTRTYINGLSTIGTSSAGVMEYNYHDFLGSTIATKDNSTTLTYSYNLFGGERGVVVEDFTYTDSPLNHSWKIYTGTTGTVTTEQNATIGTRVMRVQSSNGYGFGIARGYTPYPPLNISRSKLSVKYKTNDQMIFYARVLGKDGKGYYLQYYIGVDGTTSYNGDTYILKLGSALKDGKWRLLERDLQKDLKEGFGVEFDKVLWFCIRGGDYYLDDLRLEGPDLKDDNSRKFTDEDQDQTGLYYLRARYYDPELGRFISADSYRGDLYDPLSLNRYVYVKNNPLRFIDPNGNAAQPTTMQWKGQYKKKTVDYVVGCLEAGLAAEVAAKTAKKVMGKKIVDIVEVAITAGGETITLTGTAVAVTAGIVYVGGYAFALGHEFVESGDAKALAHFITDNAVQLFEDSPGLSSPTQNYGGGSTNVFEDCQIL